MGIRGTVACLIALVACGPSTGGTSADASSDESAATLSTGTTGVVPTTGDATTVDGTTGSLFDTRCEEVFAGREVAAGLLVIYSFGNQIEASDLQIFIDGSIYHNERTCCPPLDTTMPEMLLDGAAMTALQAQAAAVMAADATAENLGPMADGQSTGYMCVIVDGEVATVRAFEGGVDVVKRVSSAPEAADIAALVHGFTAIDMPE
jgi:hypothetical protein